MSVDILNAANVMFKVVILIILKVLKYYFELCPINNNQNML